MNYEHWCLQFQPASNLELNLFFLLRDVIELIQPHKQFQIIQFLYANLLSQQQQCNFTLQNLKWSSY